MEPLRMQEVEAVGGEFEHSEAGEGIGRGERVAVDEIEGRVERHLHHLDVFCWFFLGGKVGVSEGF